MPTRFAAVTRVIALPWFPQLLAQSPPAPRVPADGLSLITGPLLTARSSATVSRTQRSQSGSERLAKVCCLSSRPRHDRRVSRPVACVLPAGRTAQPVGVRRHPVAWGQPGAGRRWWRCHGKGALYFLCPSYIIVRNKTMNVLYQTILLLSLEHIASLDPLTGKATNFPERSDNSRIFLLTVGCGIREPQTFR
jgi:hypothetical protein